jgi:hypothetical protein
MEDLVLDLDDPDDAQLAEALALARDLVLDLPARPGVRRG